MIGSLDKTQYPRLGTLARSIEASMGRIPEPDRLAVDEWPYTDILPVFVLWLMSVWSQRDPPRHSKLAPHYRSNWPKLNQPSYGRCSKDKHHSPAGHDHVLPDLQMDK